MAELLIRLRTDSVTGKKTVVIDYQSDDDALPMEHEDTHRQLVDQLIAGGALRAEQLGEIVIQRGGHTTVILEKEAATDGPAALSSSAD